MTKFSWKKSLPHFTAIIIFLLLPIIYFSPVLENKQLNQHDSQTYAGMSKEIVDYNKKSDDLALWTNSMFGGMPSYLIGLPTTTAITYVYTVTNLYNWRPINFIFLYLIGFYITLLLFGLSRCKGSPRDNEQIFPITLERISLPSFIHRGRSIGLQNRTSQFLAVSA